MSIRNSHEKFKYEMGNRFIKKLSEFSRGL
jgi:hypothetical protein